MNSELLRSSSRSSSSSSRSEQRLQSACNLPAHGTDSVGKLKPKFQTMQASCLSPRQQLPAGIVAQLFIYAGWSLLLSLPGKLDSGIAAVLGCQLLVGSFALYGGAVQCNNPALCIDTILGNLR
jgi:hypothetical protein